MALSGSRYLPLDNLPCASSTDVLPEVKTFSLKSIRKIIRNLSCLVLMRMKST
jgi:hypothetical protein